MEGSFKVLLRHNPWNIQLKPTNLQFSKCLVFCLPLFCSGAEELNKKWKLLGPRIGTHLIRSDTSVATIKFSSFVVGKFWPHFYFCHIVVIQRQRQKYQEVINIENWGESCLPQSQVTSFLLLATRWPSLHAAVEEMRVDSWREYERGEEKQVWGWMSWEDRDRNFLFPKLKLNVCLKTNF